MRSDLYSYGRPRDPVVTVGMEATVQQDFVCARCGCSATTGDHRLLAAIGWKVLPSDPGDEELPALCPPCSRKTLRRL